MPATSGGERVGVGPEEAVRLGRDRRPAIGHRRRQRAEVLDGVEGISFTRFESKDVVRHPLVQKIVDAYERHEATADSE